MRDRSGRSLTGYDLDGAGLLVYAIEGDGASPEDDDALRLADRKDVEAVCLLVGPQRAQPVDVPHVLATDVVHVQPGEPLPLALLVERIADRADERGYGFAARLPVLRQAVCESIIGRFSLQNGAIGALVFVPGADLPVLTLNQLRMVFRIAAAYGEDIGRERAFELLAVIGAGLGFRALARQVLAFVPGFGWAVKGGVAYAATRALGEAAVAYFDAGVPKRVQDAVRSRS